MKITEEVLKNGVWISEELFRYNNPGRCVRYFKIIKCLHCGEDSFSDTSNIGIFCSRKCAFAYTLEKRMKKHMVNRIGEKYNKLIVLEKVIKIERNRNVTYWLCKCDCGNETIVRDDHLVKGTTKACGCLISRTARETQRKNFIKKANQLGYADYDTYADRLIAGGEEVNRHPNEPEVLQVKCKYCGKKFSPKPKEAMERCRFIEGTSIRENNLYCSTGCQKSCPLFHKTEKSYLNYMNGTIPLNREVQPELRQMRFELDDYTCQRCEIRGGEIHCHHYEGIWINPIESADLDMCITLCVDCHKLVHQQDGCTYYDFRKCKEYKYNSTPKGEAIYV